jgi:hypothetical protein
MSKPFKQLRDKMLPEAQAVAHEHAEQLLAQQPTLVTFKQALPDLAAKIQEASRIHEESWVDKPRYDSDGFVFSAGYYIVSLEEACKQACEGDELSTQLLKLLFTCCWNDALAWAEEVLEDQETLTTEVKGLAD